LTIKVGQTRKDLAEPRCRATCVLQIYDKYLELVCGGILRNCKVTTYAQYSVAEEAVLNKLISQPDLQSGYVHDVTSLMHMQTTCSWRMIHHLLYGKLIFTLHTMCESCRKTWRALVCFLALVKLDLLWKERQDQYQL